MCSVSLGDDVNPWLNIGDLGQFVNSQKCGPVCRSAVNIGKYGDFNTLYLMMEASFYKSKDFTRNTKDKCFWKSNDFK